MHDLALRVHAGVRAARRDGPHGLAGEARERVLDHGLHRPRRVPLDLPAVKTGPDVGEHGPVATSGRASLTPPPRAFAPGYRREQDRERRNVSARARVRARRPAADREARRRGGRAKDRKRKAGSRRRRGEGQDPEQIPGMERRRKEQQGRQAREDGGLEVADAPGDQEKRGGEEQAEERPARRRRSRNTERHSRVQAGWFHLAFEVEKGVLRTPRQSGGIHHSDGRRVDRRVEVPPGGVLARGRPPGRRPGETPRATGPRRKARRRRETWSVPAGRRGAPRPAGRTWSGRTSRRRSRPSAAATLEIRQGREQQARSRGSRDALSRGFGDGQGDERRRGPPRSPLRARRLRGEAPRSRGRRPRQNVFHASTRPARRRPGTPLERPEDRRSRRRGARRAAASSGASARDGGVARGAKAYGEIPAAATRPSQR